MRPFSIMLLCLLALLLPHSASARPPQPPTATTGLSPDCPYKTIFVDPVNDHFGGIVSRKAEAFRQRYLELAPVALARRGFQIVPERSEAWFILRTMANSASGLKAGVVLKPTVKLYHHIFIIMMNDEKLAYLQELGTTSYTTFNPNVRMSELEQWIEGDVRVVVEADAEGLAALCRASEELVKEGWDEIEELRLKLVDEMLRLRRERKNATQQKKLRIEIEDAAKP